MIKEAAKFSEKEYMNDGSIQYAAYYTCKKDDNTDNVKDITKQYIERLNRFFVQVLNSEEVVEFNASITIDEDHTKIDYDNILEIEVHEGIDDWFIGNSIKSEYREFIDLFEESLYHIANDYRLSYFIQSSLFAIDHTCNFLESYYTLWSMGYKPIILDKTKVILI